MDTAFIVPAPLGCEPMPEPKAVNFIAIAWPALLKRDTAASYLDMSPEQFDRNCPVPPVDLGARGHRWKKDKLDAWIFSLPDRPHPPGDAPDETADHGGDDSPEARRAASLARLG